MKKHLLFVSIFLMGALILKAQWQPDLRLTNNAGSSQTSRSNAWSIASSRDTLHVVWEDNRDVNSEIYYKRSTDGGLSWGSDTRLSNDTRVSNQSSIAVSGSVVHVVWSDSRDGQYEIYYKRSTDAGVTWGADTRLSALDFYYSGLPSLAVSGSVVSVVWESSYGNGIFYKGSLDGGVSWGTDKQLSDPAAKNAKGEVSVAVSDLLVHVTWSDRRTDPNGEIYYKRSTDGGITWGEDTRLTNDPSYSFAPSISVSGSMVHIIWIDHRAGFNQIFYKRSLDKGISWGADIQLTYDSETFREPNLSTSGSNLHIVWRNSTAGFTALYYKRSTDAGISWDEDLQFVNNSSHSVSPSVSASDSVVHVVWSDDRDGNYEIYYKRNLTGNPVGLEKFQKTDLQFTVFPNPASSEIKIRSLENFNELTIYDIYGKEIYQSGVLNPSVELHFPVFDIPTGIYFIQIKNETGKSLQKFIKL